MTGRAVGGSAQRIELAPGYSIARVINGCWQLSRGHQRQEVASEAALDGWTQLAEAGFTTFDCADIYTGVESLLGDFLERWRARGRSADEIQIHTKYVPDLDALAGLDRTQVTAIIDRSLSRLGVERLDLVQLAWWDYAVPGYVETAGWLAELVGAGKIRHLGATNFDTPRLSEILEAGVDLVAHQVQYSAADRRPEQGMAALCDEYGVGMLAYGSLAGGFLSDRYLGAPEPREPLTNRSLVKYRLIIDELGGWGVFQHLLRALAVVAGKHGVSLAAVAARWVLDRPGVAAIIAGAKDAAHLEENLHMLSLRLDDEDLERIGGVLANAPGPSGDTFGLEREPEGPHSAIMWKNLNRSR